MKVVNITDGTTSTGSLTVTSKGAIFLGAPVKITPPMPVDYKAIYELLLRWEPQEDLTETNAYIEAIEDRRNIRTRAIGGRYAAGIKTASLSLETTFSLQ